MFHNYSKLEKHKGCNMNSIIVKSFAAACMGNGESCACMLMQIADSVWLILHYKCGSNRMVQRKTNCFAARLLISWYCSVCQQLY